MLLRTEAEIRQAASDLRYYLDVTSQEPLASANEEARDHVRGAESALLWVLGEERVQEDGLGAVTATLEAVRSVRRRLAD